MIRNFTLGLLLLLAVAATVTAQERAATPAQTSASSSAPTVTVSVSAKGVRFAALGSASRMRLEVFGAEGESLYNSGFQAGSVRDWAAEDARGQSLTDGTYLCVVTVRDVSGRLSVRQGSVVVQGGQVSLQLSEAEPTGAVEAEKGLAPVAGETAVTLTAHDGQDGQIVTTRGALSFRAGDFFGGRDRELMRLTPEGNLGVGVARPEAKLDVAGTIRARGIQFEDGSLLTSAGAARRKAPVAQSPSGAAADVAVANVAGTGTPESVTKWLDASGTLGNSNISESGGNVGIGTASPNGNLDILAALPKVWIGKSSSVNPDANLAPRILFGDSTSANPALFAFVSNDTTVGHGIGAFQWANYGLTTTEKRVASIGGILSGTSSGGALVFFTANAGTLAERARIDNTGNVGIGTTGPRDVLHVVASNSNTIFPNTAAGMIIQNVNPTDNNYSSISFQNSAGGGDVVFGAVHLSATATGAARRGAFVIGTAGTSAGGVVERLRVDDSGNVGVGTKNPQVKLDVAGDMNVSGNAVVAGNIAAKYQDVAEWVSARQRLGAGTVVVLDTARPNTVAASTRAYDTRVAGVVSAQPGLILGQSGEGKVLVAMTGRVRVKVDATRRPVRVGDLLVTSPRPGLAMRSQPVRVGGVLFHRPGTIIGKALEPLAGGEGEILVLLSLQ